MRKTAFAVLMIATSLAPLARAERIELGAAVGYNEPIDQADASDDILASARVRLPIGAIVKLEPALTWVDMDRTPYRVRGVVQEIEKWSIVSTTLNLTFGRHFGRPGYHPYATAGLGYYLIRRDEGPDQDRLGANGGLGIMILMTPDISVDGSARLERIALERGGTRALFNVRVGVHVHLGEL